MALWEWIESLTAGETVRARVEVWPRGGAKSSTGELGVARCGVKLSRRFALYLSETQDQANLHVQAIGTLMEALGMERAVNQYGQAKGWKVSLLRCANGFNVLALGLDSASRGVKLDQYRPDLILCDDIDNQSDSIETVDKKIRTLTTAILPAGSPDCAVLFLQNKIHKNGIVAQLCDGRADFLHDRESANEYPAVVGLKTDTVPQENGPNVYRIIGGTATWEGQNLKVCEKQINTWGLKAFQREANHEVKDADGIFFRASMLGSVLPAEVPPLRKVCLAGDLAATEGGGDYTALVLMGVDYAGKYYVLMVLRGQWSSERVRQVINLARTYYRAQYKALTLHLPQDGGQAGKAQAEQMKAKWSGAKTDPVTGSKSVRATNFSEAVNLGNVSLVAADVPEVFAPYIENRQSWRWHTAFIDELSDFKESVTTQVDDQVDAGSDAHTELFGRPMSAAAGGARPLQTQGYKPR